jgi:hypothetical protein
MINNYWLVSFALQFAVSAHRLMTKKRFSRYFLVGRPERSKFKTGKRREVTYCT